ncbi:hypothetical protein CEXT_216061 [Caerostris extrusa]|uniref:Uncharacterized protein n=1 Tax=Caerostris extrusa TaxID=172846 RepID=A0AAV4SQQ3_CAEEX|nr:hypothetical protein CEXT_216061 [Caerostris extrusa]
MPPVLCVDLTVLISSFPQHRTTVTISDPEEEEMNDIRFRTPDRRRTSSRRRFPDHARFPLPHDLVDAPPLGRALGHPEHRHPLAQPLVGAGQDLHPLNREPFSVLTLPENEGQVSCGDTLEACHPRAALWCPLSAISTLLSNVITTSDMQT